MMLARMAAGWGACVLVVGSLSIAMPRASDVVKEWSQGDQVKRLIEKFRLLAPHELADQTKQDEMEGIANELSGMGLTIVPLLVDACHESLVRQNAAMNLNSPAAEGILDNEGSFMSFLAATLTKMGKAVVPQLVLLLEQKDACRGLAISALQGIGPDAVDAAPTIARGLTDEDALVRQNAFTALGVLECRAAAVTVLVEALQASAAQVRLEAANRLGALGAAATAAIPALKEAKRDPDPMVAESAERALKRIIDGSERKH